ncbi:MAG: integrase arm-type DNA-binding domain-containing protein, partial [Acidobacteria bacterium]|nr:integrase arm-type DNA-binding domain-containing protein [Acidobacteriota bacterium]
MNEERKGRKLTSRYVSTLKTTNASGERFYDPEIRGLFLTVYSSGRRSRGLRYGTRARRRWFKLGDYPSVLPEDARKAAQAALAELANGKDPAMDRRAARAGTMTFSTWCDEYIEERRRDLKRPDAVAYYLNKARARWGLRDVADVKPMDVRALFNAHKATPVLANRLRATLSACFNAAVRRKLIPSNPVTEAALVKHRETARSRVLSEEELGRLWLAITEESDEHARAAFRLLLETGARVGEVLAAKWADLDLAG